MTASEKPLTIRLKVLFKSPWYPDIGSAYPEEATEFRLYDDGVWEFLDKSGNPICQGVDASLECNHTNPRKP